jgi:shikimate kinase
MRLVICGPCGVGKSTIARALSNLTRTIYLDFDFQGIVDMENRHGQISPFSVSALNFKDSIPLILNTPNQDFILDIGGDTVFRKNTDNEERLAQVFWLKTTYMAQIVVLTARKVILKSRFLSTRPHNRDEFEEVWSSWSNIAHRYWQQCGDIFIDTSDLTAADVIEELIVY